MKRIIIFTIIISISNLMIGQSIPNVYVSTTELIAGNANRKTTIEIIINDDTTTTYHVKVDKEGKFKQLFDVLKKPALGSNIILWSKDSKGRESTKIVVKANSSENSLLLLTSNSSNTSTFLDPAIAGRTVDYKTTIWNTNFSIPLARFNFTKNEETQKGDLVLFNSIGAGFGISLGELSETRNDDGLLINQEFVSTFGIHLGFLFSAGSGDDTKNVFAPTLNLSVLDFQIGVGYELGKLVPNQDEVFLTLSYAIPLYKLKKGSFLIWKASTPITSPQESRLGK